MAWNHRDRAASAQWLTISANTKRNNMLIDGQRLPVSSPQIREQRQGVCGKPLDLGGALFMRTEQVDDDGARPGGVERADPLRYLRLCAERCVAPRGLTKIHRVPDAQGLGGGIECLPVGVVEPRTADGRCQSGSKFAQPQWRRARSWPGWTRIFPGSRHKRAIRPLIGQRVAGPVRSGRRTRLVVHPPGAAAATCARPRTRKSGRGGRLSRRSTACAIPRCFP